MRKLIVMCIMLSGCVTDDRESMCLIDEFDGVEHPDVAGIYDVTWGKMTVNNNMTSYTYEVGPQDFKVLWVDQSETPGTPTIINVSNCAGMLVPGENWRYLESDCSLRMHQLMSAVGFYSMETTGYIRIDNNTIDIYISGNYRVPSIRLEGEQIFEATAVYNDELTRKSFEMNEEELVVLGARTLNLSPGGKDGAGLCSR
jgi:hypothetical protein